MIKAILKIRFDEETGYLCKVVHKALMPDDKTPPREFTIKSYCRENILIYEIQSKSLQLLTLASIIDEISRLCEAVEKTVKYLKRIK